MSNLVNWKTYLDHAVISDIGMRRSTNQDSQAVMLAPDKETWHARGHLFTVADGMGAHAAGELASKIACDTIPHMYHKFSNLPQANALRKSIREVNAIIHKRGQANAEFNGMGTTDSTLVLLPQGALIAHVGDSRVYRLRGKMLEQLTFDHSLVWEMRAAGHMTGEPLTSIVPKNIITRSLGPHPDVQVDLEGPFPIEVGDIFFLCSDGVSAGKIDDRELGALLGALPPLEAARIIVDLANLRGGPDNITVIVVRITHKALATVPENQLLPIGEDLHDKKARSRSLYIWFAAALVFFVLGIVFISAITLPGNGMIGGVSLIASLLFLVFGVLQSFDSSEPDKAYLAPGKMLGKGPYTSLECEADSALSDDLARRVRELRDAATAGNWSIDWSRFNNHARAGVEAADNSDFVAAVREYSRALHAMMTELRHQHQKQQKADDAAIDL